MLNNLLIGVCFGGGEIEELALIRKEGQKSNHVKMLRIMKTF